MLDTDLIIKLFNTALTHKNNGEFAEAKKYYEEILKITDKIPEVYFNLSFVYTNLDMHQEALECMKNFVHFEPNDTESKYFLATNYFMLKDYENGFDLFEYRISKKHAVLTQLKMYGDMFKNIPFWQGESLKDKTIFVYYEAGLGDTLMYYRYLQDLAKICKQVIFKPQLSLLPLFAENRNGIKLITRFTAEIASKVDFQCPIMSLPYFLKLNNKSIFSHTDKFLTAKKKKSNFYKEKYFNNDKLKIGIKWQGNTLIGGERAMNAESFSKIFEIPNSKIYSVQVMDGHDEIKKLQEKFDITDLGSTFKNFSDTASAIDNLDIIICNDTSVGHLSGAMGKKTYIILPKCYDWRWHFDITKCDWYDSVKLFRQKTNWEEVINRIYNDILNKK